MTTTESEIRPYNPGGFSTQARVAVSQATAIEQSRAIAEVQAAVIVAQSCPRDMAEAEREMEYVCGRLDMAEQAFYQVTNRGTGASVHLMRELARVWGNVDYGVRELARNDERGESEVQAFAWDQQRNTRSSRTFINPHQRMVKVNGVQQRKDLTDLQDIYLSNNNVGARAVRECIAAILPRWFTEKAQNICHNTLKHGEGKPLQDRIAALVKAFDGIGVSVAQLEARVDRKRGAWTPEDLAQLTVAGQSIRRGEAQAAELFPPITDASSTADEIVAAPAPDPAPEAAAAGESSDADTDAGRGEPEPAADDTPAAAPEVSAGRRRALNRMFKLFSEAECEDRDDQIAVQASILDRVDNPPVHRDALTDIELRDVLAQLDSWRRASKQTLVTKVGDITDLAAIDRAQQDAEPEQPSGGDEQGTLV